MLSFAVPATTAALHIPDGFLTLPVALACWLISFILLGLALRRSRATFREQLAPLAGIMAAFIFAAQMLNFPVAGGTSGHLLGGALAAITLGPWVGMLVMTAVITLQALLFQDGGLAVMGANILNMGLLTALIGFGLTRIVAGRSWRTVAAVAALAAWASVMVGALATAVQLWLSGTVALRFVLPAMMSVHALIGIGEALITVAALGFIVRRQPALLSESRQSAGRGWSLLAVVSVLLLLLLAPFASADPDGLERVAADLGFLDRAQDAPFELLPDYTVPVLGSTNLSTVAAGLAGALLVGLGALLLVRFLAGERAGSHIDTFDRYQPADSLIHRLDPRTKVVLTVLFILSNLLVPDGAWLAFGVAWAFILLGSLLARLGAGYTLKRSFVALPFALAAVTVIFSLPGRPAFAVTIGPWTAVATDAGLLRFLSVVVRSWLSVQMAILITATTPFPDLIHALRHLYVPQPLVVIISFMYRYLFVLADEGVRLFRAREGRSARLEPYRAGGTFLWRAQIVGHMVGQLFMRSFERSERVYQAMLARGYTGRLLTLNPHRMTGVDWLVGALGVAGLLAIQLLARIL